MKTILSTNELIDELRRDEYASWSYDGAKALADYLQEYEESTGEELEFDPIAIRCEFTEYENAIDAAAQYTSEFTTEAAALEYLQDHTSVITYDGGVIIQDF